MSSPAISRSPVRLPYINLNADVADNPIIMPSVPGYPVVVNNNITIDLFGPKTACVLVVLGGALYYLYYVPTSVVDIVTGSTLTTVGSVIYYLVLPALDSYRLIAYAYRSSKTLAVLAFGFGRDYVLPASRVGRNLIISAFKSGLKLVRYASKYLKPKTRNPRKPLQIPGAQDYTSKSPRRSPRFRPLEQGLKMLVDDSVQTSSWVNRKNISSVGSTIVTILVTFFLAWVGYFELFQSKSVPNVPSVPSLGYHP